jgi:Fe-S-cluster containining protein
MLGALRGEQESDVPCGGCTACCTASQFVHIGPDEVDALSAIPQELLFPAPGAPRGHVLMGYDERGHCPMLVEGGCSVYEHRPRACRTYDCRIFAATGIEVDEPGKTQVEQRARRWRFEVDGPSDRVRMAALRAAAAYLADRPERLPSGTVPVTATGRAVLALEIHDLFLQRDSDGQVTPVVPQAEVVGAELLRRARGDV